MAEPKSETFAACSCFHVPFQNDDSIDWMLSRLADIQPDNFVMLGDLFDASAVSVHPHEYEHALEYEYEQGALILQRIMGVIPNANYVWCLGNHDDNIKASDPRRSPYQLRSLMNWNNHHEFGRTFLHWNQIPYRKDTRGVYKLGQVCFSHGYDAGVNSDELETLQLAMFTGGQAWRLFIRGHTHRPTPNIMQCCRTKRIPLPWYYANAGTLGPLSPDYMKRKDSSQWGAGIVVGETNTHSPRRASRAEWDAHVEIK